MKKWIFATLLFLGFSGSILAQVKANTNQTLYCNGDSYGFYIDPIEGAVSYEWSTQGLTQATIWPAWDTAIDLTFSRPGMCDVICTVTMDDNSVRVYALQVDVYEE